MATRRDVAELAGVSQTSVSYYLNNSGYVSREAAEKIQNAINELNYRPNQVAKSLKTGDSRQFAFFCNEIRNPFYSQLVYDASKAASANGYMILFSTIIDDQVYVERLYGFQVGGAFASNKKLKSELINGFAKQAPIVVLMDVESNDLDDRVIRIKIDYRKAMSLICSQLSSTGCHSIFYLSATSDEKEATLDSKTEAFNEFAPTSSSVLYGFEDASSSYMHLRSYLKENSAPDAFVCANDAVALGAIKAVHDSGYRVPEDVAVFGFDNTINSEFNYGGISSVDIKADILGKTVIDLLMSRIKGEEVNSFYVEPALVLRGTTRL